MASPLLNLPRELRDKIISLVIAAPHTAPEDARSAGTRTVIRDYNANGKSDILDSKIYLSYVIDQVAPRLTQPSWE